MQRKIEEKLRAISLRKQGYSVNEITSKLGIAKSSISVWVRNVELSQRARERLLKKISAGRLYAAEMKRNHTRLKLDNYRDVAGRAMSEIKIDRTLCKILCSLLYWCEGAKNPLSGVSFINSDPNLISTFLYLLRNGFELDESKFRVCVHLHGYHNIKKQIRYWSKITNISEKKFIKPFMKENAGKRIKKNYPGCAALRYHSNDIARQLLMTAEVFLAKYN
ncbi:MAG TPA: hypothetical protein DEQ86_00560 [Candidatus Jacksonbacteria bacterium]|nr:hypothetical protein [Candidatus Jacksonbacteria bacterium]